MMKPSLDDALALLLSRIQPLPGLERVPLDQAPGRVLGADLTARLDQPPFHRSPLDGYALRSADLVQVPALLPVTDHIFAGDRPHAPLGPGQAARIMTGAPIPAGADCVVRQEDTDGGEETVTVRVSLRPHQNFCFRGEDVKAGAPLFPQGTRLDWTHIPALASQGFGQVEVCPRPRVAVLTTGSELTPAGTPLAPGAIYDSNGPMLLARLEALHMEPILLPPVPDCPEALTAALGEALATAHLVLTSGGVSVGRRDHLPQVVAEMGAELLFHGVAAKPGGVVLAALLKGKAIIALSGNPFAAAAMFEVLARPALEKLSGAAGVFPQRCTAVLGDGFPKPSPQRRLVRGALIGDQVTLPAQGHGSGLIASLSGCNCLVDIPAGSPALPEGHRVSVLLFS